jgi:DNA-binding transcriptional LysR family regulator
VRLLDRGRHGVEPTEYGRALLNGGNAMFDELRQAVKNIEFIADPTVGEVRIGATDPLSAGVIPAVLERLHRRFPRISTHVTSIVQNAQYYHDLRDRKIDLLLGSTGGSGMGARSRDRQRIDPPGWQGTKE